MVSDRFRLRYTLTPDHHQKHTQAAFKRISKFSPWSLLGPILLIAILLGIMPSLLVSSGYILDRDVDAGFIGAALAIIMIYVIRLIRCRTSSSVVNKLIGSHNVVVGKFTLAAYDGGGLQITGQHVSTSYDWDAFIDLTQTPDILIIWIDTGLGVIIPNSAFADDEEQQQFAEFVTERIESHKQAT